MVDLDLYFEIYRNWLWGMLCNKFVDIPCVLEKHVTLIFNVEFYMWPWYCVVQLLCRVQLFATHVLQHAKLPCPSLSPGVCSKLCPLSPTISSSVAPFFSCPQSFPASGSFPVSWLFTSGGQSIGASASTSVLPMNIQVWLVGSLCCPRSSQESSAPQFESIDSLAVSFLYSPTLMSVHDCWKNRIFDYLNLCRQVMSLLFNMLSRFIISFLPRSNRLLISSLQSPSPMILEPKKTKSCHCFHIPTPSICHEVMGLNAMNLVFWMLSFKPAFFTFLLHLH